MAGKEICGRGSQKGQRTLETKGFRSGSKTVVRSLPSAQQEAGDLLDWAVAVCSEGWDLCPLPSVPLPPGMDPPEPDSAAGFLLARLLLFLCLFTQHSSVATKNQYRGPSC